MSQRNLTSRRIYAVGSFAHQDASNRRELALPVPLYNVLGIKVNSIRAPRPINNVQSHFQIDFRLAAGGTVYTWNPAPGIYTPGQLAESLDLWIENSANTGGGSTIFTNASCSCTYDEVTGEFTITAVASGADVTMFGRTATNTTQRNILEAMGYPYTDRTITSSGNSFVSTPFSFIMARRLAGAFFNNIRTQSGPIVTDDFYGTESAYGFASNLKSYNASLLAIFEIEAYSDDASYIYYNDDRNIVWLDGYHDLQKIDIHIRPLDKTYEYLLSNADDANQKWIIDFQVFTDEAIGFGVQQQIRFNPKLNPFPGVEIPPHKKLALG